MKLFGYGKGKGLKEYRPQVNKVHPLERATALVQCKERDRLGRSHGRMGVLDVKDISVFSLRSRKRIGPNKWSTCECL